jgi:hypothetical protein
VGRDDCLYLLLADQLLVVELHTWAVLHRIRVPHERLSGMRLHSDGRLLVLTAATDRKVWPACLIGLALTVSNDRARISGV